MKWIDPHSCFGWKTEALIKSVSIIVFAILTVVSSLSACAMSALIADQGHILADFTQTGLAMNYGEYNDPWDYFGFVMANSTATTNNDGYGIAAYRNGDAYVHPDSMWFKRVLSSVDLGQTYYTGRYLDPNYQNSSWDYDILDLAMNEIKTEADSAAIVLCHARNATGASMGNHPFWFQHNGKTYTFMHNGNSRSAKYYMINRINQMNPGVSWFSQNPSNYFNNPDATQWVDSELLFRYIMCHIIANQDDALAGLNNALKGISTYIDNVTHGVFNFIMSDGSRLYAFRSTPLTGTGSQYKLSYRDFPGQFQAIRTQIPSAGDIQLQLQELVVFSRDQSPMHYPNFVHGYYVTTHQFPKTYVNEVSPPLNIILQSSSADTLFVTNVYWKSQPNPSYFSLTFDQLNIPVLPGSSTAIQAFFAPLSEGVFTDTLCVVSNSQYHPLLQIPLSGRGYSLHASYTYVPMAEEVQLLVNFADTSTEDISAWNWDFGDGNTSTEQNPMHVFAAEGTYAVELSVSDGVHIDSILHDVPVIAHAMMACADTLVYDFGTEYLGYSSEPVSITLRSSGADTLSINNIRWQNGSTGFQCSYTDLPALLLPSETTAIDIWFQPAQTGVFSDSLIIETNAENLPVLKVKVSGRGEYVPPKAPENVHIEMDGSSAVISWEAVTQSIYNAPFTPDSYLVFFSADPYGTYAFLGSSTNLSYTDDMAAADQPFLFYKVIAYKDFGEREFNPAILGLMRGMEEVEVLRLLRMH